MSLCVVYPSPDGGLAFAYPTAEQPDMEAFAAAVVPDGEPHRVIDTDTLPQALTYQQSWRLDFSDPESVVTPDPAVLAELVAADRMRLLDQWFADEVESGFPTADGWSLGLTQQDVSLLTGYYVLAKEAAALGMPIPPIVDMDGVPHEIEAIEELTAIMLAYGQRRAEISAEYAAQKAEILAG